MRTFATTSELDANLLVDVLGKIEDSLLLGSLGGVAGVATAGATTAAASIGVVAATTAGAASLRGAGMLASSSAASLVSRRASGDVRIDKRVDVSLGDALWKDEAGSGGDEGGLTRSDMLAVL